MEKYNNLTISQYKTFFKKIGSSYSLGKKDKYVERFKLFYNVLSFPWREDQRKIIQEVVKDEHKYYVINGIFGCGKTTMLFGMLINLILKQTYKSEDIMFISFNVCIKNEIKRKLKPYGFKGKIRVSTFDSIVYFICKRLGYKYLDLPNFDGKRRFCYEKCLDGEASPEINQPKLIFIDEVQDLEKNCLFFFKYFFPNSKIVFAGDVFQSIQKEPRESLLWSLLNNADPSDDVQKFYMNITPRVPRNILFSLQKTLSEYYPEFSHEIAGWKSNNITSKATVTWNRLYSYSDIFKAAKQKIDLYGEKNTMILTFSSAITVKGALGDVARFRMQLVGQNYDLNKNHKKIEEDKLFLSTANSSKGLERDHVVVFLTFPLERAFSNFSDDIVINLITVAITRAKKTVDFYVPAYKDKFTNILNYFNECPQPNKQRLREGKDIKDFKFQDYMDMDKCVTELIRQSVLFYDTRLEIKEQVKMYQNDKCFNGQITVKRPIMLCEEERAMVGVIIENLITSTWSGKWPQISSIENLREHPMYIHIFRRIEKSFNRYITFMSKSSVHNNKQQFDGIYLYSQLHLAMYNKLFITFPQEAIDRLEKYWYALKPKVIEFKPDNETLSIQVNLQMPWITGIADAVFYKNDKNGKNDEVHLWEIKASVDRNWKDDALTQAVCYSLMTGKTWSRITLINPFRNEKATYHFNSRNIMTLRNKIYKDAITWNLNCYLAKSYNSRNIKTLDVNNLYFAHLNYMKKECCVCKINKKTAIFEPCHHQICFECGEKLTNCPTCNEHVVKIIPPQPIQLTIMEMLSPTKSFVRVNKFFKTILPSNLKKIEKLSRESNEVYSDDWIKEQKKDIWLSGDVKEGCNSLKEFYPDTIDFKSKFNYTVKTDLQRYSLDFTDGLVITCCYIASLADDYKFI